ncbi:hypothetical protein COLO4_25705 [Corchorus olitorius]|uniref:S1 motif domain-containing protein n=1 Tax=Corchorus olitorius TaxID=93759 RepID=A0A1R3I0C1_9ROSI|nr:hypothetical protein COLO4_25705 [Corchorus olitorius]
MEYAVVTTSPTPDGKIAIDSFHQFAGVKWLCEKPLSKFEDAQWLLIQKAEEQKLLEVTVKLPEKSLNTFLHKYFYDAYFSKNVNRWAQQWNAQRKLIMNDAFNGFLLPSMEREARLLLTSRAKNWLLTEYGKVLWNKVSVGPYRKKEDDMDSEPRVMACCWGPCSPATTFVMLDSSGEVLDVLYTGSLTLRSQNANDQQSKKDDQQRLLKFMTDHQPHVVLGAVNLSCTRLKDDIYEIIFKMVEENPRDVGHGMDELSIVYGDESLPRLYENSRISSDQLPGQSGIVKRAVALGRHLQNPLAMVATLCGPGKEILSWKLSPLENFLTADEKYGMIEQVMVDVTNQLGLDVNLALSHEWLFGPLQFISGLGPRKAASLQRSLARLGTIFTRKNFETHGLGETEDTLAVGRIVQATVRRVLGNRAICVLESGLTGMIMKEDYADDWRDIVELSDRLHEGDILTCKIKSIQKNRYQFLSDKDPGESVIHPSSRGPSHLTLTLKVYDGVYAHKDIVEGGKEHKGITSLLRIGKTLKIGEDTFEDLDEVVDRYIDPLASHLKAMLSYRKFRRGNKKEVDELLRIEKAENPTRTAYCSGISHEHPGSFILTYIQNTNPHHEYVGLYPKGFKFRKRMFEDIDHLVSYFQRHI